MNDSGVEATSDGDEAPTADTRVIEVRVAELRQLFDALDPSPFRDRDLDPKAAEHIVGWARELPRDAALALLVHLDRAAGASDEVNVLRDAIQQYFNGRAAAARQRLRLLLRVGRSSLAIGITFLAAAFGVAEVVGALLAESALGGLLRETVVIGGWVAMWRPLEIFLYDWWPIRAEARLFDRLGVMPIRIKYRNDEGSDAWRHDWPAESAERRHAKSAHDRD